MVIVPGFEPILRVPFSLMTRESEAWSQGVLSTAAGNVAKIGGAAACLQILGGSAVFLGKQVALHGRRKRNPIHADTDAKHRKAEGPG